MISDKLNQIKESRGVLVLGSSESGELSGRLQGRNYWALLNRDGQVRRNFAVLSGAGRWCYAYFPLILRHRRILRDIDILYYLQLYSWPRPYNRFRYDFYRHFNGRRLVEAIVPDARRHGIYERFVQPFFDFGTTDPPAEIAPREDNFKGVIGESVLPESERPDRIDQMSIEALRRGLNMNLNVSEDFAQDHPQADYSPVDRASSFQTDALCSFIRLAEEFELRLTVWIGPFNAIYARHADPATVSGYEALLREVRDMLARTGVRVLDGSGLSTEPGMFYDRQHHSAYGAWRIAQALAPHYR